jgi:circadian clock protein KaiC
MSKVTIRRLSTGVPGLDTILGGGLPEFSFNLITGPPGSGKTTLAHQIMFSLATPERPAVFFSALGEPPIKMLRYQQQFNFFDPEKLGRAIRFVNLSDEVATGEYEQVLARITHEIEAGGAALVVVDSFRSIMLEAPRADSDGFSAQQFVQLLGSQLSSWEATSFLVGEYVQDRDSQGQPIFTVADGLLALDQSVHRNSMVRKIQVLKMRGQATLPGVHTMRITDGGIEVFPSAPVRDDSGASARQERPERPRKRLGVGVPRLDEMLGGGLPSGYSLLVAGPSGAGKTVLATQFLVEGVSRGEPGVMVAFEQTPSQSLNPTIDNMVRAGQIGLINTRSLDLSIDEIAQNLIHRIREMKASRVVIDSLSGFELAVAPSFRDDFREAIFRMVAALSNLGATVLMTSELEDRYTDLRFSSYGSAFLTDAIVVQRYIEVESRFKRVMAVVKVRASTHSSEIREYQITDSGIVIGERVVDYEGILGGRPMRSTGNDTGNNGKAP